MDFSTWSTRENKKVGKHRLTVMTAAENAMEIAPAVLAEIAPEHYASPERIADVLERLGKPAAAAYIRGRLPTTKTARSGDLGEILSSEYIAAEAEYVVPIKRLRWKDHRNMAMRGDDLIAIRPPSKRTRIGFLKAETKSRAALNAATVTEARDALNAHNGLPSPHALGFVSDRLHETGKDEFGDLIDDAQLNEGISVGQVEHLLFTFSGNGPSSFLSDNLNAYDGPISQYAVGLRVATHEQLIAAVYDLLVGQDVS